ncbi:hypothetical protein PGTUg99_009536 [Puccinia graminis f. sp. tritici]|uniref:Uncharacterized protein n=1 Tax=Puccinia graminis f. sp. tritici TaxID=56615 RepID=A0A5B0SCD6_PUCGR|nr:hypothetical protein PGTUg99_009536 [Puccinia graminis f. sp. tritici]
MFKQLTARAIPRVTLVRLSLGVSAYYGEINLRILVIINRERKGEDGMSACIYLMGAYSNVHQVFGRYSGFHIFG